MFWIAAAFAADDPEALVERAWAADPERIAREARLEAEALDRPALPEPDFRPVLKNVGSRTEPLGASLRLRQGIEPLGGLRTERRALAASVEAGRAELAVERLSVRAEVLDAWDTVRIGRVREALLDQVATLQEERLGISTLRVEAGLPDQDEAAKAALERAQARVQAAEVSLERGQALATLHALVGTVDVGVVTLESLEAEVVGSLTVTTAPVSTWLDARVRAAEQALSAERAQRRSLIRWVEGGVDVAPDEAPEVSLRVSMPLPSFRFLDGEVQRASAELEGVRRARTALEQANARVLEAEQARYRAGSEAVQRSRAALDEAASVLEPLLEAVSPADRLDLQARLLDLRERHLDVLSEALQARRRLESARLAVRSTGE